MSQKVGSGAVDFTVIATLNDNTPTLVNIPVSPTTLIGIMAQAPVQIPLDSSHFAIVSPIGVTAVVDGYYFPVSWPVSGTQLNVTTLGLSSSNTSITILYFGRPGPNNISLKAFAAVYSIVSLSNSGSSAATISTNVQLTFPAGTITYTGAFIVDFQSAANYIQFSFNSPLSGALVQGFVPKGAVNSQAYRGILALDNIKGATSLSVTLSANLPASTTENIMLIMYYNYQ
ncbi:MAG: hypothetical protein QW429_03925 [Thermoprotei archaeon]